MEVLNLILGLLGVLVGLFGVWSKIGPFLRRIKDRIMHRAEASAVRSELHIELRETDALYFLAYVTRNLVMALCLLGLALALKLISEAFGLSEITVNVIRFILGLISGAFVGGVLGTSMRVMRRKRTEMQ